MELITINSAYESINGLCWIIVHLSNCCMLLYHYRHERAFRFLESTHCRQQWQQCCASYSVIGLLDTLSKKCAEVTEIKQLCYFSWQTSITSCLCISPLIESTSVLKTPLVRLLVWNFFFPEGRVLWVFINVVFNTINARQ